MECNICMEDKTLFGDDCKECHSVICKDCYDNVSLCPYCRKKYNKPQQPRISSSRQLKIFPVFINKYRVYTVNRVKYSTKKTIKSVLFKINNKCFRFSKNVDGERKYNYLIYNYNGLDKIHIKKNNITKMTINLFENKLQIF